MKRLITLEKERKTSKDTRREQPLYPKVKPSTIRTLINFSKSFVVEKSNLTNTKRIEWVLS